MIFDIKAKSRSKAFTTEGTENTEVKRSKAFAVGGLAAREGGSAENAGANFCVTEEREEKKHKQ